MHRFTSIALIALLITSCGERGGPFGMSDSGLDAGVDAAEMGVDPADMSMYPAIGEPCVGPTSCGPEALCVGRSDGEFVCMQNCATAYEICEGGEVCIPALGGERAICYIGGEVALEEPCANNLECAPGLLCIGTGDDFFCRTACSPDADQCRNEEYCRLLPSGGGICRSSTGSECSDDSACPTGAPNCVGATGSDAFFPNGYCSVEECVSDANCLSNSVCRPVPGKETSVCLQTCDDVSDCRFNDGYACLSAQRCGASSNPEGCQAMFGAESLCVSGIP